MRSENLPGYHKSVNVTADSFVKLVAAAIGLGGALTITPAARAQGARCDRGDLEVRGLDFDGNRAFADEDLAEVIVTTPSSWARRVLDLPFSPRHCLDPSTFADDRLRLTLFYRQHGFLQATVDTATAPDGPGGVDVQFTVHEGYPTRLRSFAVTGLDQVPDRAAMARGLPVRIGGRFDRVTIAAAMDTLIRRLRNHGYPAAAAVNRYVVSGTGPAAVADDTLRVTPGRRTRFGAVAVQVLPLPGSVPHIAPRVVRHIAGIDSGALYRAQALVDAQRALYQTNAFRSVAIAMGSTASRDGADSVAPVAITVAENTMFAARLGGGYGTLDCFRAQGELDDYNFLHGARTLRLQARVSKIGVGRPLAGASALCPQARQDPYSSRLNYYMGATLQQPIFLGLNTVPTITAYTARVSEYNVYVRTTVIGGVASLLWQHTPRTPVTATYSLDVGRTEAQPALFCAVFNLCTLEDRRRVQRTQRLGVLSLAVVHDASNVPGAPTAGSITRFEVRHASPLILSDTARFTTFLGDVAQYVPIGGAVLALHLRSGAVLGSGFIPPQERMYAGGPASVRGFAQNELGDATYIATAYDTVRVAAPPAIATYFRVADSAHRYRRAVPVGGNSLVVGTVELRLRSPVLPELFQFGIFTDAGDVWNRGGDAFHDFSLKITPGVQVAALTPVGPVRVVVGYNPYRRPPGPLYYESSAAAGNALPCVSPGNTIPVAADSTGRLVQADARCPGTFQPPATKSFRSRLTFGLAIGQAF